MATATCGTPQKQAFLFVTCDSPKSKRSKPLAKSKAHQHVMLNYLDKRRRASRRRLPFDAIADQRSSSVHQPTWRLTDPYGLLDEHHACHLHQMAQWFFASESKLTATQHHFGVKIWDLGAASPIFFSANIACMALKQAKFTATRQNWVQYWIYKQTLINHLKDHIKLYGLGSDPHAITAIAALSSFDRIEDNLDLARNHLLAVRLFLRPEELNLTQWLFIYSMDLQLAVQTEGPPLLDLYIPAPLDSPSDKVEFCPRNLEIREKRWAHMLSDVPHTLRDSLLDIIAGLDILTATLSKSVTERPQYGQMYRIERQLCELSSSTRKQTPPPHSADEPALLPFIWALHISYLVFTRDIGTQRGEMIVTILSRVGGYNDFPTTGPNIKPMTVWSLFVFTAAAIEYKHSVLPFVSKKLQDALHTAKIDSHPRFSTMIEQFPSLSAWTRPAHRKIWDMIGCSARKKWVINDVESVFGRLSRWEEYGRHHFESPT